nr:immunoglobulin heavy chain junction region [Mus musculus]
CGRNWERGFAYW